MVSGLVIFLLSTVTLSAQTVDCREGTYGHGKNSSFYKVCVPPGPAWNHDLVVFAHGYISPTEALEVQDYEVPVSEGGPSYKVSEIITGLGYAFATTSYSDNGLVIPQGVENIKDLALLFPELSGKSAPNHVYLVGASEGGLVTALALEKYPDIFDAGLATCGPVGNFREQINYFGDFLVLFNYFFPGVLANIPGTMGETPTPAGIPKKIVNEVTWNNYIVPAVLNAVSSNPGATQELLSVSNAAIDSSNPVTVQTTILGILWYGIFATNDAIDKLGGCPYGNTLRWYSGSSNDLLLNWSVERFRADPKALHAIAKGYQTSGKLISPLVTMHTTGDPIVPYWHEPLYTLKTLFSGSLLRHLNIPRERYGHCTFYQNELLEAFAAMLIMAGT